MHSNIVEIVEVVEIVESAQYPAPGRGTLHYPPPQPSPMTRGGGGRWTPKYRLCPGGRLLDSKNFSPAAQGNMKMTWENIAYDHEGGR